jgi:hypothetical protein
MRATWKCAIALCTAFGAALLIAGCGGGGSSSSPSTSASPLTVTVSGPANTLNTGGPFPFTAAVKDATSGEVSSGVTWSVVEPEGGTITPDGIYTAPEVPGTYTVRAIAQADPGASGTASVTVVTVQSGALPGYDVGVDYQAFGSNFETTAFITIYDQPLVRAAVLAELQGMADRGATFIHTSLWFVNAPGSGNLGQTWRATFPMTSQEAANLRAYAQDVASVQGARGNRLRLTLSMKWLGAADYTKGSPSVGLGPTSLSAAEFVARVEATTNSVLAAVSDVVRPDGTRVVDTIYLGSGVRVGATQNEEWFLKANYPFFVKAVTNAGITPSLYFGTAVSQSDVLDDAYVDAKYPILNGHRSMFWVYRSLLFMTSNNLPLPPRIDFSCYMTSTGASFGSLLQRILQDADATLHSLGAAKAYGVVETFYYSASGQRLEFGRAYADEATVNPHLKRVSFWTTPNGGGTGANEAYPFSIEDYLPPPVHAVAATQGVHSRARQLKLARAGKALSF